MRNASKAKRFGFQFFWQKACFSTSLHHYSVCKSPKSDFLIFVYGQKYKNKQKSLKNCLKISCFFFHKKFDNKILDVLNLYF